MSQVSLARAALRNKGTARGERLARQVLQRRAGETFRTIEDLMDAMMERDDWDFVSDANLPYEGKPYPDWIKGTWWSYDPRRELVLVGDEARDLEILSYDEAGGYPGD